MHEHLLARGRGSEKQPGEFGRSQNRIGGTGPGNAHFVPPPPAFVDDLMSALERTFHERTALLAGISLSFGAGGRQNIAVSTVNT
jgi:Fic family protein